MLHQKLTTKAPFSCTFLFILGFLIFIPEISMASDSIQVEVVNIHHSDHHLYEGIGTSVFPAFPVRDSTKRLANDDQEFYDYVFRITYDLPFVNKSNQVLIRVFIISPSQLQIAIDSDMDGKVEISEAKNVKTGKDTFDIQLGKNRLSYELFIPDKDALYTHRMGNIHIKPLTYFRGKFNAELDSSELIVVDDVVGVKIYKANMSMDTTNLAFVKLGQLFEDEFGKLHQFTRFDVFASKLFLDYSVKEEKPEGVDVGYYVNTNELSRLLKRPIADKKIVLYFWGIWCKPCLDKFDETLKYQTFVQKQQKVDMFFCSFNVTNEDIEKTKLFIEGVVEEKQQIHLLAAEGRSVLSDPIHFSSLLSMLKVSTYPTYLVIDENGKIVYRSSDISKKMYDVVN